MAEIQELTRLVDRRHPDYVSMLPHWEFMEQCYLGGRKWFTENIFRYLKEGDGEFRDRVARAYRFNHTREVVDLVNKYLFRADIVRNKVDAPKSVVKFWERATLQGLSIDEFMRIASTKSSVGGRPWVIVDTTTTDIPENASVADVEDGKVYAYVVSPVDVLDMSYDETGELNWIIVREWFRDDADPYGDNEALLERFRLWTRNQWVLVGYRRDPGDTNVGSSRPKTEETKANLEIVDSGTHSLGVVPAVKVDNSVSDDPWSSPALIADIAYLDRATANYASNLDAIIQDQTFSQLAMPAQNVLPGDDAYNQILEMGTKRIFLYDGESGKGPEYLSPDPRQAQLILSAIQQLINEIYHSVGLAGERTKQDNAKGIDNSSGVAKAHDFERVTALLASKADSLETAENKIARLVALWSGDTVGKDLVEYPDTFDVRGFRDELDIAMQLGLIDVPEMMRSEQMKVLAEKLFPGLSDDLKTKMSAAIVTWHDELKEKSEIALTQSKEGGAMLEEAARNRTASGNKQSETKSRETGAK